MSTPTCAARPSANGADTLQKRHVRTRPAHGTLVAPGLYAPHHQHWFSVRLDMTVDGPHNSVYEVDSAAEPVGPGNPHGNAWVTRSRLLAREGEAQRDLDPLAGRY